MQWFNVYDHPPMDGQIVIAAHCLGKWVEPEVMYYELGFYKRVNANTGGMAGFQCLKDANGNSIPVDERRFGFRVFPTHWAPIPSPPKT